VTPRAIQIWFQNQRQRNKKRDKPVGEGTTNSPSSSPQSAAELNSCLMKLVGLSKHGQNDSSDSCSSLREQMAPATNNSQSVASEGDTRTSSTSLKMNFCPSQMQLFNTNDMSCSTSSTVRGGINIGMQGSINGINGTKDENYIGVMKGVGGTNGTGGLKYGFARGFNGGMNVGMNSGLNGSCTNGFNHGLNGMNGGMDGGVKGGVNGYINGGFKGDANGMSEPSAEQRVVPSSSLGSAGLSSTGLHGGYSWPQPQMQMSYFNVPPMPPSGPPLAMPMTQPMAQSMHGLQPLSVSSQFMPQMPLAAPIHSAVPPSGMPPQHGLQAGEQPRSDQLAPAQLWQHGYAVAGAKFPPAASASIEQRLHLPSTPHLGLGYYQPPIQAQPPGHRAPYAPTPSSVQSLSPCSMAQQGGNTSAPPPPQPPPLSQQQQPQQTVPPHLQWQGMPQQPQVMPQQLLQTQPSHLAQPSLLPLQQSAHPPTDQQQQQQQIQYLSTQPQQRPQQQPRQQPHPYSAACTNFPSAGNQPASSAGQSWPKHEMMNVPRANVNFMQSGYLQPNRQASQPATYPAMLPCEGGLA